MSAIVRRATCLANTTVARSMSHTIRRAPVRTNHDIVLVDLRRGVCEWGDRETHRPACVPAAEQPKHTSGWQRSARRAKS